MYTLAHISDPHLAPLPKASPALLSNKRVLGYLSWSLRRHKVHLAEVLERLGEDMRRQSPDHVAVTGDITNISLPAEFEQAAAWLQALGPASQVSVVPGNHDAYIGLPWESSLALWADYMGGRHPQQQAAKDVDGGCAIEAEERPARSASDFPYLRRRGPLAVVGVSSACPTMPFSAAGAVGEEQLARVGGLLRALREEEVFRVVLIHHPPLPGGAARRKQLRDSRRFREVIAENGAELILHGHTHRSSLARVAGPGDSEVPVIGVAAASAGREHKGKGLARYHLYRVAGSAAKGWSLETEVRAMDSSLQGVEAAARFTINYPA